MKSQLNSSSAAIQNLRAVNARYNEIENFCAPKEYHGLFVSKDGTKKNFVYKLQRHERFIRHEKILSEFAALYKIRRPVIFSPYERKAVDIKISGVTASDFANRKIFDLLLTENNLQEKLRIGGLYWKIKIEEEEMHSGGAVEKYFGTDGNLIRYEYFHTFNAEENFFVLPAQSYEDLHVKIFGGEKIFKFGYNSILKERAFKKITLLDFEKMTLKFFQMKFRAKMKNYACVPKATFKKFFPASTLRAKEKFSLQSLKVSMPKILIRCQYIATKTNILFRLKHACSAKFAINLSLSAL